jgi:hypothetical protein
VFSNSIPLKKLKLRGKYQDKNFSQWIFACSLRCLRQGPGGRLLVYGQKRLRIMPRTPNGGYRCPFIRQSSGCRPVHGVGAGRDIGRAAGGQLPYAGCSQSPRWFRRHTESLRR